MLTPFKENGEVDYDGLTHLTECYIKSGAQGLFANCLSSEMFELTEAERIRVVQHVVRTANGAVPVVATGTFEGSVNDQADFVKRIYDLGTQAVIVITGLMADKHEGDDVFNRNVYALLEQTGTIPLGFYECPVPYKRLITPGQLKLFIDTGRVTYHKDTSLDLEQVKEKISAGTGFSFGLYDAYMVNAVESLKAGAEGLSCIQGNYFPSLLVWLCDNYDNNELSGEVAKVMSFFVDNMELMHDVYPFSAKYCLQKQGLNISTTTRTESKAFTAGVRNHVENLYHQYQQLQKDIQLETTEYSF